MIYLDNAATTKPCRAAVEAATLAMEKLYYNPSSLHFGGLEVNEYLRSCRKTVADAFGAPPEEIIFTSGGTEGDNTVLMSAVPWHAKHVIVSAIEHDAVIEPAKKLASMGVKVDFAHAGPDGVVTPDEIARLLTPETGLVSVMTVNNETGAIQPIREIASLLKRKKSKAILHTDAVQGFLKTETPLSGGGAEIATVSAHEIGGLKGVGAIWHKKAVRIRPLILGGGQESGDRSGTEPIPAIAAFAAACEERKRALSSDLAHVREASEEGKKLLAAVPGCQVLTYPDASPFIINLALPGYKSQVVLNALSAKGICLSSGSACSKGRISRVLEEMGVEHALADGFLRVSLSHENTTEDLHQLSLALSGILPTLVRLD
ncbi:MAG: cysteine desulfurase [Clostridia bacterium]|nr:cysteine desulfurase [Clostridia bacterium]